MPDTIFGRIARGEVAVPLFHSDDLCVAFADIDPQAPVHLLVIPREAFINVSAAPAPLLGHLMEVAARLGREHCPRGFRLMVNEGEEVGQTVPHLHIHVLGGCVMT